MFATRTALRSALAAMLVTLVLLGTAGPSAAAPGAIVRGETAAPSTPTASEGIGIRLLDVPVATQNDPRAQSYIVDHVNPGKTIERRVEVSNGSPDAQTVRVYATAARVVDGSFLPYDDSPNELSTWIDPAQDTLELAPGEKAEVMVTIDVADDAPEGEQYAAVWAEVRNTQTADNEEGQVALANRAGIRVYLAVGPGNGPPADFEIDTLTAGRDDTDTPVITAEVTNTGGRAVDVSGELNLTDGPGGISAGPFTVEGATTIAPGATGQVQINLDPQLPAGPWTAGLELSSGLVTRDTTAEVTFPEAGESTTTGQSLSTWWWLAAALVVALLVFTGIWWRRRATVA